MKCLLCNKEFSDRGLAIHIKLIHKIDAETYYLTYMKQPKGKCICGNHTTFYNINKGYLKYCSEKCHANHYWSTEIGIQQKKKLSKERKNKRRPEISKLMKNKYQDENEIIKLKEVINDPSSKRKRSKSMKKAWKDPETRMNYHEGRQKYYKSNKAKKNFEKKRKEMLNGGAVHAASFITDISKPQIKLFELIKKIISTAKLNYPVNGLFLIDIAIPQLKIAFEYDCAYWHQDSKKDNERQSYLESLGWSFIRYKDYIPTYNQLIKDINKFLFIGD